MSAASGPDRDGRHPQIRFEALAGLEQALHGEGSQPVEDVQAFAPVRHQAGLPQAAQVL
jgi:hypothetical protein